MKALILIIANHHSGVSRFFYGKTFSRQNRKGIFTNSVKVGVGSTSNTGSGADPILGVPALDSNFESIRMVPSRFCLSGTYVLVMQWCGRIR